MSCILSPNWFNAHKHGTEHLNRELKVKKKCSLNLKVKVVFESLVSILTYCPETKLSLNHFLGNIKIYCISMI